MTHMIRIGRLNRITILGLTLIVLTLIACGGNGDTPGERPTATGAGEASSADSSTATPVVQAQDRSSASLDEYLMAVCEGQAGSTAWEEDGSIRELSSGLGQHIEILESLEPPVEVSDWHDAALAFQRAFKRNVDDYIEDSKGQSEDEFILSMFLTLASDFEPIEQAIAGMDPGVRSRMIEAGCIDDGTAQGGRVITEFASIDVGDDHTCGVGTDGYVGCWGGNFAGEATPPEGKFSAVSAGWIHTCGVRIDGSVSCWGGDDDDESTMPPGGEFTSVSAWSRNTCGVRTDGTVACWGADDDGQATPPAGKFTSVSAGKSHTCGVRTDGSVACWGKDFLGLATPPEGEFVSVSAAFAHNCGVRTDGSVACWGQDISGEATLPEGEFVSVSAGGYHTCGIRADGTVACWGDDDHGQATPPAGKFTSVSAGQYRTCGIRTDASAVCWGSNEDGRHTPPSAP